MLSVLERVEGALFPTQIKFEENVSIFGVFCGSNVTCATEGVHHSSPYYFSLIYPHGKVLGVLERRDDGPFPTQIIFGKKLLGFYFWQCCVPECPVSAVLGQNGSSPK